MPHRWDPVAPRVRGLVRPVPVDASGERGPTRGQAQGPGWRRTGKNRYLPSAVSDDLVEQRILEHGARCEGLGAVTGWASLRMQRGGFFDGLSGDGRTRLPVPLLEGDGRLRQLTGSVVQRGPLDPADVVEPYGIRCTCAERAVLDEVRRVDELRAGVRVVDMACAAELTSLSRVRCYLAAHPERRGKDRARAVLDLAVEDSCSPGETDLRLVWRIDAGWPEPLCNRAVRDLDGRFLGRPDLLDPVRGIVGEYNGAEHRSPARQRNDVRRADLFRRAGLEYFEVVGADLADAWTVVERMEATAERAGARPRRWVVDPPGRSLEDLLDERDHR